MLEELNAIKYNSIGERELQASYKNVRLCRSEGLVLDKQKWLIAGNPALVTNC